MGGNRHKVILVVNLGLSFWWEKCERMVVGSNLTRKLLRLSFWFYLDDAAITPIPGKLNIDFMDRSQRGVESVIAANHDARGVWCEHVRRRPHTSGLLTRF